MEGVSLRETWELRNAAAATLIKAEAQLRRLLETASVAEVNGFLEAFSPARSGGPEWTRTLAALPERLGTWCAPATLAAVEREFRARGPNWLSVANALTPERGQELQAQLRRSSSSGEARLPPFT